MRVAFDARSLVAPALRGWDRHLVNLVRELEAMARGRVAVVSGWGAAAEVLGPLGTTVDPRETSEAARAVVRCLADPDREEQGRRCRAHAGAFTWARTAEQTLQLYRMLVDGSGA